MGTITKRGLLAAGAGLALAGPALARTPAPPFVTRHEGVFNGQRVR